MERTKTLTEQLEAAKGDACLENLIFRYYQDLELGDSHWRESMCLDKIKKGEECAFEKCPVSKRQEEEARLVKENPGVDVNLLMLQRKYGRGRDF